MRRGAPCSWVVVLIEASCGVSSCPEEHVKLTEASPVIEDVELINNAVPEDPWELVFTARFHDHDRDLGGGFAEVYLNGRETPTVLRLYQVFRQSALPLDAESGTLGLPLRFADTLHDGDRVRLGLQLLDEEGHRSNCYSLDLRFQVRKLISELRARAASLSLL
jgi:hypothetical protein